MQAAAHHNQEKVIVGLGLTGLSCARYLAGRGETFTVVDSRENPPGLAELRRLYPDVRVELGKFSESTLSRADELIVSPGVDLRTPALRRSMQAGVRVTGDVDIFARQARAPIVAVTGSNAKSTVVTMVGEMAGQAGSRAAIGGNIGTPVLDLLEGDPPDLYILEVSSFQLETTTGLGAEVATVLNMSADHMDRYDSMQAYHRAKHRIFQGCRQVAVNRDDALSEPLLPASVKRWSFGLSKPGLNEFGIITREGEEWLAFHEKGLMPVRELKVAGRHNVANALAALAIGTAMGFDDEAMVRALRGFPGLPHRCQWVADRQGVSYYNDSKGTNVGAALAAIEGLAGRGPVILLAGGLGKGSDFTPLGKAMARHGKLAIVFGRDAGELSSALEGSVEIRFAGGLEEAVWQAGDAAEPGDIVLLSPACASFDMFRDYKHRGEVFIEAVKELAS